MGMAIAHLSDPHLRVGPLAAEPVAGLHRALGGGATDRCYYTVDYPEATVVVLDSWDISLGGNPGRLGAEQLAWLDEQLSRRPGVPALLCLHHPPVTIGVPFLDGMNLRDAAELEPVVRKHPHVARILTGHVHRSVVAGFAGTVVTTAPSTYRQIELTLREDRPIGFVADPTGFLLHLVRNEGVVTHSVPVSHAAASIGAF